jgi:hypothetical protein
MDHSAFAFVILIFILLYLLALKFAPEFARLMLAGVGAVAAIFAVIFAGSPIVNSIGNGAYERATPVFTMFVIAIFVGAPAGTWLVWKLTRPR